MTSDPIPQSKKWLIVFLIYSDFTTNEVLPMIGKMKIAINSMLGDIINTKIDNQKMRVFIIMNSIKFFSQNGKDEVDDRTIFYQVECKDNSEQNDITYCELIPNIDENGVPIFQKAEKLAHVLRRTNVQPDEEIFLNTWDHGSAFGIFKQVVREQTATTRIRIMEEVNKNLDHYPFLKKFWNHVSRKKEYNDFFSKKNQVENYITIQEGHTLYKVRGKLPSNFIETQKSTERFLQRSLTAVDTTGKSPREILKNSELSDAIMIWLGDLRKVGVLMMTNCWMMNMHTMYAFKSTVKCLIAPQGDIDCPGYNYRDIFKYVDDTAAFIPPSELAIKCVEFSENTFAKARGVLLNEDEPDIVEFFKIFAVNLELKMPNDPDIYLLDKQINVLKSFIEALCKELDESKDSAEAKFFLKYVRSACFDFSVSDAMVVDIVNWAFSIQNADDAFTLGKRERISRNMINPTNNLTRVMLNAELTMILASTEGKKIYDPPGNNTSGKPYAVINLPPTGYSLFFPMYDFTHLEDKRTLIDDVRTDGLLTRELEVWKSFLKKIAPGIGNVFDVPGAS